MTKPAAKVTSLCKTLETCDLSASLDCMEREQISVDNYSQDAALSILGPDRLGLGRLSEGVRFFNIREILTPGGHFFVTDTQTPTQLLSYINLVNK